MHMVKVFDNLRVMKYIRERVKNSPRIMGETHNKIHLPAKAIIQKGKSKNILKE